MGIPAPIGVSAAGLPPLGDQANAVVQGTVAAIGPQAPFAFQGPMNLAVWASINTTLTTTAASLSATVASATGLAVGNAINSANVPRGATIGALVGTTVTLALPPVSYPVSGLNIAGNRQVTLPPGSNVNALLGAAVSVPSTAERVTLAANTTVTQIIQADVAPSLNSEGVPGIVLLSALPTAVPPEAAPVPLSFARTANAIQTTGADTAAKFTGAAISFNAIFNVERSFDGGATFLVCNVGGSGQVATYGSASTTPVQLTFGEPERQVLYRLNFTAYTSGAINWRVSTTGQAATSISVPAIS